ncbi:MAG TPA: class I SAM-dependent methyltransferase [Tepidisphaeraceae bacterium]|nr:class I SAM-dependent methyltransferase [Tepidisphaeraceae bacterium]
MALISGLRGRFRGWINGGRFPALTRPAYGFWRLLGHARGIALRGRVIRQVRAVPPVEHDDRRLDDVVRLIGDGFHGLIYSMQVPFEIAGFLREVERLRPRRVLEIGTARGGTLFALTRVADPAAFLISLDLPGGRWGGGYPWWKSKLYKSLALPGQRIELVRGNSHAPESFEAVKRLLGGERLDLLFIDGDHEYAGAKHDFEQYRTLVRPGGMIAFHDIADHPAGAGGDVPRLWREIRAGRDAREFVKDPNGGYGIGVIYA